MLRMLIFTYNFSRKCVKYTLSLLLLDVILKLLPTKVWMSQSQCQK